MREENQRLERRRIPRIARQILDPFPRISVTGRLRLRDPREQELRRREFRKVLRASSASARSA
jgi:hypothetical protein